jgi:hypothetical protein
MPKGKGYSIIFFHGRSAQFRRPSGRAYSRSFFQFALIPAFLGAFFSVVGVLLAPLRLGLCALGFALIDRFAALLLLFRRLPLALLLWNFAALRAAGFFAQ